MNVCVRFDDSINDSSSYVENSVYVHKPLRITKGNNSHKYGPSALLFIITICPVDMNVYARFDEIPSITLKDIKKTKHYGRRDGRTYGRTDGQCENSIPAHKHSLRGV